MTNEELLSVAEIVERLVARFHKQAADHEAKMFEHRAAFGARTKADAETIDRLHTERDALRAEVAALQESLRAEKKQGDALWCEAHELRKLKSQTPKQHPVKVGEWVRITGNCYDDAPHGYIVEVLGVLRNPNTYTYTVIDQSGHRVDWSSEYCEPCEPPETHAEPDLTQLHAKGKEAWSDVPNATQWVEEMRGNTEATHDTEAGKAAAAAAVKTEPVADEIKVGDVVEVFQSTASCTFKTDIGTRGTVLQLDDSCVDTAPLDGFLAPKCNHVALCDVRKVTT